MIEIEKLQLEQENEAQFLYMFDRCCSKMSIFRCIVLRKSSVMAGSCHDHKYVGMLRKVLGVGSSQPNSKYY